jgi:hypothetical protein
MPLQKGSSEAVISANIAELVRAGHPQEQAEAIAYAEAGKDRGAGYDCGPATWGGATGGAEPITPQCGCHTEGTTPDPLPELVARERTVGDRRPKRVDVHVHMEDN